MPAVSKAQQRFFGMVDAYRKGDLKSSEVSKNIKRAADDMSMKEIKKFAKTKHKGLPNHKKSKKKVDENVIESVVKQVIGEFYLNEAISKTIEVSRKKAIELASDHNCVSKEIAERYTDSELQEVLRQLSTRDRKLKLKKEIKENKSNNMKKKVVKINEDILNRIVRESINKIAGKICQINESIYVGSGGGYYGGSAILTVDNDEGTTEYRFRPSGWDFDTTSQLEAAAICAGANKSFFQLMSESGLTTLPVDTPTDYDKREALYWLTGGNKEWKYGYWVEDYDIEWNDAVEIFMQDSELVGLIDNAVSDSNNFYELVVNLKNNNWMEYAVEDLTEYERYEKDDMEESINREQLRRLVKENVKRMLSEGGDFLMQHDDGEYVTTSKRLYRNVPGAIFIWHGDSADPEILYKNHLINYYNVEDGLWLYYKEECEENGTEPTEEGYEEWAEQLETDFIISELDDIIAGL